MLCGDEFLKCGENVMRSVVIGYIYECALHKIRLSIPGCNYSKLWVMSNLRKKLTDYRYRAWTGNHLIVIFSFNIESVKLIDRQPDAIKQ